LQAGGRVALEMEYDVIVVGAGIAGASIAYELARSCRVCVVEGETRPGYHATGRSAALFAPSYGGREIRALTRASLAFFRDPGRAFGEQPLLSPRGCMYVARDDQRVRLEAMVRDLRSSGSRVTTIDAGAARLYVPRLRPGHAVTAAFDADAMDIDVDALHQGFLRGARAAGAELVKGCWIERAERMQGRWCIETAAGTVTAPTLVNAAGAWADVVAEHCGARALGMQALRRTAALVDAPDGSDVRTWPAVIDADELFYFKPEAGQLLLSPADETPTSPCDVLPDELDIAIAVDRVQAALELDVRHVKRSWAGLRTFAPDRVPVVGFDVRVPGLFWCAGQGGYGIQSAPALARAAAALVLRQPLPPDIAAEGLDAAAVSPARFEPSPAAAASLG
jgi:D-arginine dehydrogenase